MSTHRTPPAAPNPEPANASKNAPMHIKLNVLLFIPCHARPISPEKKKGGLRLPRQAPSALAFLLSYIQHCPSRSSGAASIGLHLHIVHICIDVAIRHSQPLLGSFGLLATSLLLVDLGFLRRWAAFDRRRCPRGLRAAIIKVSFACNDVLVTKLKHIHVQNVCR